MSLEEMRIDALEKGGKTGIGRRRGGLCALFKMGFLKGQGLAFSPAVCLASPPLAGRRREAPEAPPSGGPYGEMRWGGE